MSDQELLELAAKAVGHRVIWYGTNPEVCLMHAPGGASGTRWNPLHDDGDALRLAVNLRITPHIEAHMTDAESVKGFAAEAHNGDPYAATRRAIVRAAAAIGEVMP